MLLLGLVVLAACSRSVDAERVSTTTTLAPETTATTFPEDSTSSTVAEPDEDSIDCDVSRYFPSPVPERARVQQPSASDAPFDPVLSIAGTSSRFLVDASGDLVLVMLRGTLPPEEWAEDPEVIDILDGLPAAVGPLSDGVWAVAWVESEDDPCDWYTLLVYPPTGADEAKELAESL
jgi:hypothetical protein